MEQLDNHMDELAALNPCIKFIIDNYGMLCLAHPGKVVMVINSGDVGFGPGARVVKTFDTLIDAMMYVDAVDIRDVPYAIKECVGGEATTNLMFSVGCKGA